MQDGFLSLFRKYFCKEFKPFVCEVNTADISSNCNIPNDLEFDSLAADSLDLKFCSPQTMENASDFIECIQGLTQTSKRLLSPIGKINWDLAPKEFPAPKEWPQPF